MKLKLIAMLLVISTLLAVFAGCGPDKEEPENPIPEGHTAIIEDGQANFKIVYPADWGETAQAAAEELVVELENYTGVKLAVSDDNELAAEHEIRLGRVARMDALKIYDEYTGGARDFAIFARDGHIYVYAKNSQSVKAAMAYFIDTSLYKNTEHHYVGIPENYSQVYVEEENPSVDYLGSDGTYLNFMMSKGTIGQFYARISFTGNKAWRIQTKVKETDSFQDIGASQRLAIFLGEEPLLNVETITVAEEGNKITATAPDGSRCVLSTDIFRMEFLTPTGKSAQVISRLSTSLGGSSITGDLQPGEALYGTGERFDSLNQRGKDPIEMYTKDIWARSDACYMVVPLLCFTRGSGVFLNIYESMNLTPGSASKKNESDVWSAEVTGAVMDCYVYTCEQMSDAIYGYTELSGHAEMPEEWTYGMIICRYGPDLTQKWGTDIKDYEASDGRSLGVYEAIAMMEAYDLPWTTLSVEGWGAYNEGKHNDLRELCEYVHSLGKKVIVYMRVGTASGQMSGFTEDYLVHMVKPDGTVTTQLPASETLNPDTSGSSSAYPYVDITNPDAVEWFFGEYWDYLSNDVGVDGCKIDFCETVPEYYKLNYYDESQPTSGSHHWYPTAFCAMFWDMISNKPDSGMCYTRGGGIGSQRSPYMWAGDQTRQWYSLEDQIVAVLSSGMSGVPFMSYDMSGYQYGGGDGNGNMPGKYDDPYYEAQVFVRGLQFTAFTICMQQHGKVKHAWDFANGFIKQEWNAETGTWDNVKDEAGNDVYLIRPGEMSYITDIYRGYVKLHELLTPYITEYSEIACATGMPVMRPLVLMWQNDSNVYNMNNEYMFGDAFLVAPVLDKGFSRTVYLPEGEWIDLNTGAAYTITASTAKEERTIEVMADLSTLPVFYNKNTTSKTAQDLLPGIQEIFAYLNGINHDSFIVSDIK